MRTIRKILALVILTGATATVTAAITQTDPMSQRDFPCHEDEALTYVPGNTDGVECVNIEDMGR